MVLAPSKPAPVDWTAWVRRRLDSVAPAALALVLASLALWLGWRGVDQAAQTYRTVQFQLHGLELWDSNWYAGNFPLGYSVLFPAVAATFGIHVVAVASAVIATWSFDKFIRTFFGARPLGTWYFAISTILPVAIGQWPFLAGEAAGLVALVCLQRGRRPLAILFGIVAGLFSPLAAAFLALGCLAWAAYSTRRRWIIATAAVAMILVLALGVLFPGDGPMPFPWTGLAVTELLCLSCLSPLVQTTPAVRLGAAFYGVATFASWLVPNPLGGNAPRLANWIGVPLLACFLTAPGPALERLSHSGPVRRLMDQGRRIAVPDRWRYAAAVVVIVPFGVWQWAPWNGIVTSPAAVPYTSASFYQPLLSELTVAATHPVRVEVVPTFEHWESAFVAPYVSLARGWERQLDIADNPVFYTPGALTAASYDQWLSDEGISYVALPTAPLDYAGKPEANLLRSGTVPGLQLIWSTTKWQLWKVADSPGLVSGPAQLTSLEPDHLTLSASGPGTITVRVRYTKYWSVTSGAACVGPAPLPASEPGATRPTGSASDNPPYQWTSVTALAAGPIQLSATVLHETPVDGCPTS
ncbi:MAG TPA: hypothetical protein VG435_03800 [Acidimicrobiales bacterium]|jgi:hypothetical protein|nr:hypothetical protein [Acidimicrobiales bacterium]